MTKESNLKIIPGDKEKQRLFIGIDLPERIAQPLATLAAGWRREWPFQHWVHSEDYHLTLKFLGDVEMRTLPRIKESLIKNLHSLAPFSLRLGDAGLFGPREAPRILWMGVEGEVTSLYQLQNAVETAMYKCGFPRVGRPFRPHITLARRYRREKGFKLDLFQASAHALLNGSAGRREWLVREVVIYVSHLDRRPMYQALFRLPFDSDDQEE